MDRKKAIPAEWSRRRTRHDPPDLDEAIAAAQGLTDRIESQVEVAAHLSGLPEEDVRRRVLMTQSSDRAEPTGACPGRQTEVVVIKRRGLRAN